ncbi:pentapeptide repeat-containing protein [Amycolatopsis australiensis]|uniref:pentapeptide repeat-containing protein n=1 Tax=Amycolatopsis australiensis TaxID=546364 RepID=UPI0011612B3C|nr:pentapeptide repeat-containing protein [Amycolatopsis australiensis]
MALLAAMAVLFGWVDWLALGRWARPLAVPLALLAVAVGGLAVAVARRRGERTPRARSVGMSWWVVVAAAIVVAAVGWVATSWLLGEANQAGDADKRAAARVEAIKTGLGIGAGTTGIFALLLAVRRQQHSENDAAEKNVTELYTKAADQLGSDEAPVRLAGLYALERLAHNNPGQRQSIVNVICAYLRMPFSPPDAVPSAAANQTQVEEHQRRVQEREVRLAAQRILFDHLQPQERGKFWADIDLDLTNANLINFTLKSCRVETAFFRGATFTGEAMFDEATFTRGARFDDVTFTGDASFDHATFTSLGAAFDGATFLDVARFHHATLTHASFREVTFIGSAGFSFVTFIDTATFTGTTFTGAAWFDHADFNGEAIFTGATFTGAAEFTGATFTCPTWSGDVASAEFTGTTFTGAARFKYASFTGTARFNDATFIGYIEFDDVTFELPELFSYSTALVEFDRVTTAGGVRFARVALIGIGYSGGPGRVLRAALQIARASNAILDPQDFATVTSQWWINRGFVRLKRSRPRIRVVTDRRFAVRQLSGRRGRG